MKKYIVYKKVQQKLQELMTRIKSATYLSLRGRHVCDLAPKLQY